jgi:anti-sigma B factor antagonist
MAIAAMVVDMHRQDDLRLQTHVDERGTTLIVAGEVDLHTGPRLRSEVSRLLESRTRGLVVDASSVSFVDSTGLGILVGARKAASEAGVPFELRPSDRVRSLLTRTGLLGWFEVA